MESDKETFKKQRNPQETANFLSLLTYMWTLKIFWKGRKRELEENDLYEPLKEHTSSRLGDEIEKYWTEDIEKAKKQKRNPSLLKVLTKIYWPSTLFYGVLLAIIEIVLKVVQPLYLGTMLRYFTPGSTITKDEAYISAAAVVACSAIPALMIHPIGMGVSHIGMKLRVACCSLIYRKSLRLSKTALGQTTSGQVVNLLSNDVNRFEMVIMCIHYLWLGPVQTCFVLYFLWQQIGVASIIGLATLLVFIPLQAWLGKKTSSFRLKTALRTDERVRLMNEIITGIQVIKMYTWEKPFAKLVAKARKLEINEIRGASYVRFTMLSFIIFHSRLAIFSSIFAYVLLDYNITAEKVFVVTSFYNVLRQTMTIVLPFSIGMVAEALVSVKRLQKFMMYDETTLAVKGKVFNGEKKNGLAEEMIPMLPKYQAQPIVKNTLDKGIEIRKATAQWLPDSHDKTLSNINLRVEQGKLTAIIGTVGAGKTSLLHAILKELPLSEGSISVGGVISYASQEPWLFAGSVRQNILFGLDYDKDRYRQVIKVCALRQDFDQFPYGDKTIVGERGVSLSGGQRARINLARAVYKQADVYLLDDPLSAVDTHVGKHLFDDCITDFLKNKTRILITHQLQYLTNVNHIVFMESGRIQAEGNYQQVKQQAKDFTKLISNDQGDKEIMLSSKPILQPISLPHQRLSSYQSVASLYDEPNTGEPPEIEEMRSHGTVGTKIYGSYLRAGGNWCFLFFIMFLVILTQLLASGGDFWITFWVNIEEYNQNHTTLATDQPPTAPLYNFSLSTFSTPTYATSLPTNSTIEDILDPSKGYPFAITRDFCLYVFSALTLATVFITLFRSYLFCYMCTRASIKLHDHMFQSITRATMRFFNINTSGQILNRFSKDIGAIDEFLPGALVDSLQIGLTMLGVVVIMAVVNFWLMIPTMVVTVLFYLIRIVYISTSRSIKRLEGVTRSPVFGHLNSSIQGLTTIRAFQVQSLLVNEFDHHQDLHSSAFYIFIAATRAFSFWLDFICIIYTTLVIFSFLILDLGNNFGGNVGLTITQCIGLTGMFQWGMRQSAELENQMTSVERVLEYTNIDKEPSLESAPDKKPPETWPMDGKVVFSKVFMGYSPDDPPVLKNLSFVIEPKEKVGIVGRTGAGKSSLISALFRLADIQGEIIIDGINTAKIGLHDLRSKISIIPQEPVLFSGTIRKNLDPFDTWTDHTLWKALEEVELKDVVSEMSEGLNSRMSEGGANFSVGQRQLICLARAIVRNNRILVMDEATANVDPQTDGLIQTTIRRKFADCTVLTIAHRLHTVMDSDKVLVMGSGSVMEYNHPYLLLQDKNSILYSMVEQTGKSSADSLHKIAAANYQLKEKHRNKSSVKK